MQKDEEKKEEEEREKEEEEELTEFSAKGFCLQSLNSIWSLTVPSGVTPD